MTATMHEPLETRFQRGDQTAMTELYRRYSGPMFVTALGLLGDRELAADAVQRAFVQAWQAADGFDPGRELRPWLYAITRRAAVDVHRRERRGREQLGRQGPTGPDATTDGPSLDRIWRAWQVRTALDRLPPDERRVLRLAYFGGYSQREIATALGLAVGTVKSRTARAQRHLTVLLDHVR